MFLPAICPRYRQPRGREELVQKEALNQNTYASRHHDNLARGRSSYLVCIVQQPGRLGSFDKPISAQTAECAANVQWNRDLVDARTSRDVKALDEMDDEARSATHARMRTIQPILARRSMVSG